MRPNHLVVFLVMAMSVPAQEGVVKEWIERAAQTLEKESPEAAAEHLRCATLYLSRVVDKEKRKELLERIERLRSSLDPLEEQRRKVAEKTARIKVELARKYAGLKWYRTALGLLEEAENLVPGSATEPLEEMRGFLGLGSQDMLTAWFKGGQELGEVQGWKVSRDQVASPAPPRTPLAKLSTRSIDAPRRVTLEVKMGTGLICCILLFGFKDDGNHYTVQVMQNKERTHFQIGRVRRDRKNEGYATKWVPESGVDRDGWLKLWLEIDEKGFKCSAGGAEPLVHRTGEKENAFGRIGLGVVSLGDGGSHPIFFRNFAIGKR